MAKKSTQWVTIPEASIHTPVSGAAKAAAPKKGDSPEFVKNKMFWGIGFLVVVVASFAVLAPSQFSGLLKGNLFESTGIPEGETGGIINPLNLLKPETPAPEAEAAPANEPEAPAANEVVAPQDKPVDVSVEPISTPEVVSVEPVKPAVADCGADMACFTPHLKDCSLAKSVLAFTVFGQSIESNFELTGMEAENCLVNATLAKSPMPNLIGMEAKCTLAKGEYTQASLKAIVSDPAQLAKACSGPLVDALKAFMPAPVANDQGKQIDDLLKQVEALQSQKEESTKMMQDLVKIVQDQKQEGVRPAAPVANVPTASVQPGFRANPYRVSVTPEQMLSQRSAGYQPAVQQASAYQQPATQSYQPVYQPVRGENTPQTGPEQIAIFLMTAFVGMVFWKFTRTFVA